MQRTVLMKTQNYVIANLSSLVTEEIVREVADSWYTIKVDGTRDPTGIENISIIVRFVKDNCEVTERLLSMTTTEKGDAQTLTNTIITELEKNGLSTSKILSQVYDGASLMSGKKRRSTENFAGQIRKSDSVRTLLQSSAPSCGSSCNIQSLRLKTSLMCVTCFTNS